MSAKGIRLFALTMLIVGSIDSIRNLPATALFGSSLIFFLLFASFLFLIPAALVSADLSARFPKSGGIYNWCKLAFGEKIAVLSIWLQWINTMVWFPTILSFIAGTAAYLIDPSLVHNKVYLVSIILGVFWLLTLLNFKGVKVSTTFASLCAILGMALPMLIIVILAVIWLLLGKPIHLHLTVNNIIPHFDHLQSWISLTAIMTAFVGMELAAVHVNSVNKPQFTFPRALGLATLIIIITMLLGSLSIAYVIPTGKINLIAGVMETFAYFFHAYHLSWLTPVLALLLLIGSIGGMVNWMISPAKGLLQAAEDHYLPKFLQRTNQQQVPTHLMVLQGVVVSIICFLFLFMPSINSSYWLLTDLSTQMYMLMYVLMFLAGVVLHKHAPETKQVHFEIPGKYGIYLVAGLGLIGCLITLYVGFFPPASLHLGSQVHYEMIFIISLLVLILPVISLFLYKRKLKIPG